MHLSMIPIPMKARTLRNSEASAMIMVRSGILYESVAKGKGIGSTSKESCQTLKSVKTILNINGLYILVPHNICPI